MLYEEDFFLQTLPRYFCENRSTLIDDNFLQQNLQC